MEAKLRHGSGSKTRRCRAEDSLLAIAIVADGFNCVAFSNLQTVRLQSHGSSFYGSRCLSPLACTYTFQMCFIGLEYVQHCPLTVVKACPS